MDQRENSNANSVEPIVRKLHNHLFFPQRFLLTLNDNRIPHKRQPINPTDKACS